MIATIAEKKKVQRSYGNRALLFIITQLPLSEQARL